MSKESYVIVFAILLGAVTMIFTCVYKDAEIKHNQEYNKLEQMYQTKNDSGFLYLLKHPVSPLPLANTLETLSKTEEDERPAKVQELIETAKAQATEVDEQLMMFVNFSDTFSEKEEGEIINHVYYEDIDLFLLVSGPTWNPMYSISYRYWKSTPKVLDEYTREYLLSLTEELRSLDKTFTELKDSSNTQSLIFSDQLIGAKIKLLDKLKPHLIKIKQLNESLLTHYHNQ
ncbi:hypothetical protein [Paenibacillus gallinarum]|uniref:Lipoprotein n=1 Tax=Paenibacillus gallinarum TaxID=2762232 RepID=A0ABR8T4X1_9BACL|nr:hypothetical protein [Paenibacillus gallinarum]MBD7970588.1 hypothetical protein [Paenibacillus gallinarum]